MKQKVNCIYCVTAKDNSPLSSFGAAYLDKALRKIAYQSLKTSFAKSGNPRTLAIMATAFDSEQEENNREWKEYVELSFNGVKLIERKLHTYRKQKVTVKDENGKEEEIEIRVPCKPFYTVGLSKAGREYLEDIDEKHKTETTVTFSDILMQAWEAAADLNDKGLLYDYSSIWMLKREIYNKLNANITTEKRRSARRIDAETEQEQLENTKCTWAEREFIDVETSIMYEQVCEEVKKHLKVRDKESAVMAWSYCKLAGYTVRDTASIMSIEKTQVQRYVSAVTKVMKAIYA